MGAVGASRHTEIVKADGGGVARAAAILRAGGLVAFPTETVYGLGAHALDRVAVRGIFEAKQRPADDPLIVHLADARWLDEFARPNPAALCLAERFWPGPLTLVLPRLPHVPDEVTAGRGTVAVRVPAHDVARALLAAARIPIAAPSANLFGRPSPTRATHVVQDLNGRIDLILDDGPTQVGVESTIVDLSTSEPRLLRPGGVPAEAIQDVLGTVLLPPPRPMPGPQESPGLLASHYAPRTPLTLVVGPAMAARDRLATEVRRALATGQRVGVLLLADDARLIAPEATAAAVGSYEDPHDSAVQFFDALRSLDAQDLDVLFARDLADPTRGLGRALADRLRRAARRVIDTEA